jgi:hypothetical protein
LDKNDKLFHNIDKQYIIEKKTDTIFHLNERVQDLLNEYEKTQNKELLHQAVHIQIKEIQPEIRNLRNLKYEIMEINEMVENNRIVFSLFQYPIELSKLINDSGEPPRVIKFTK